MDRVDSIRVLQNTSKGAGTAYDTTSNMVAGISLTRNYSLMGNLYRNAWQCRRVVDFYPEKMIKSWGHLVYPDKDLILETEHYFNQLKSLYCQGQKVANLYGDGYIIRLIDDGKEPSEPVNWGDVKQVKYSRVFDNYEVRPDTLWQYGTDYYNPEYYYFSGTIDETKVNIKIHKDRVIRFKGDFLPPKEFERNDYCHASILEPFIVPYIRLEQSLAHVAEAMASFEVLLFGVKNLISDLVAGDDTQRSAIEQRYKLAQQQISSMRGAVHDMDEESVQVAERKFTNVDNVIKEVFREEVVAASGLTKTQLYNQHPAGMNSTGESELRVQAEKVKELQEYKWRDLIDFDTRLIMAQYDIFEDYSWEWINSYQATKEEEAKIRKMNAEIDKIYIETGSLAPEEARTRFEGSEYQNEITLSETLPERRKDAVERFTTEGNILINSDFAPIDIDSLANIEED